MTSTDGKNDRIYPCNSCSTMRTVAEGGATFTVCDACWDEKYRVMAPQTAEMDLRELAATQMRELDAARVEIHRLDGLVAELRAAFAEVVVERDRMRHVVTAAESWVMEREPQTATAHILSAAILEMRADRRASGVASSSCECAASDGKHASFCPAKES